MKRFFENIAACILATIGAIPRKIMHIWYIFIAITWLVSMIIMLRILWRRANCIYSITSFIWNLYGNICNMEITQK